MIKKKNLAIVPAKGFSRRLPNKNILDFEGKPLLVRSLESVLGASELFDDIHVSTDSPLVLNTLAELPSCYPKFIRPNRLSGDDIGLTEVCTFVLSAYRSMGVEFENICLLWATAPLRTASDIIESYKLLNDSADAVIGVTTYDLPFHCAQFLHQDGSIVPVSHDDFWRSTAEMPKVVCDCGSFAWVRVAALEREKTWMPSKTKGFVLDKNRSVDIDTAEDFEHAEYLYKRLLPS